MPRAIRTGYAGGGVPNETLVAGPVGDALGWVRRQLPDSIGGAAPADVPSTPWRDRRGDPDAMEDMRRARSNRRGYAGGGQADYVNPLGETREETNARINRNLRPEEGQRDVDDIRALRDYTNRGGVPVGYRGTIPRYAGGGAIRTRFGGPTDPQNEMYEDVDNYAPPITGQDPRNNVYPQDEDLDEDINLRHLPEQRPVQEARARVPRRRYADGGAVFTPRTQAFQAGGTTGTASGGPASTQEPAWGYDPSAYVSQATQYAQQQAQQGQQQYQWALNQFNQNEGTANRVTNSALQQGDIFGDAAAQGVSRYESMYAPAMQQQLQYAQQYASPENLALYRGQAVAGVGQAFDATAKANADQLQSYGLNPADVGARLDAGVRTQRAAAEAGAGTSSDINNKLIGANLLTGAIQTGQADAGLSSQMAGVGQQARNQAVNTGLATTASGSATAGSPTQWAALGNTELQQWPSAQLAGINAQTAYGNEWNDINKTNLQAQQQAQNQSSGAGALIGAGLGVLGKVAPMMMGAATGAVVPGAGTPRTAIATGSVVPASAEDHSIPGKDKVPALVGKGEGILPLDVMQWMGEKGFQQLIAKTRQDRQRQTVAQGEPVAPAAAQAADQAGTRFASEGAMA